MIKKANEKMYESLFNEIKSDERSWPVDILRYVKKRKRFAQ